MVSDAVGGVARGGGQGRLWWTGRWKRPRRARTPKGGMSLARSGGGWAQLRRVTASLGAPGGPGVTTLCRLCQSGQGPGLWWLKPGGCQPGGFLRCPSRATGGIPTAGAVSGLAVIGPAARGWWQEGTVSTPAEVYRVCTPGRVAAGAGLQWDGRALGVERHPDAGMLEMQKQRAEGNADARTMTGRFRTGPGRLRTSEPRRVMSTTLGRCQVPPDGLCCATRT